MEGSLAKEYADLARPDSSVWEEQIQAANTTVLGKSLAVPPTPPAKEMAMAIPPPTRPAPMYLNTPSRPASSASDAPSRPAPQIPSLRPLPLRAPLAMNPPTRPGTANTETSRVHFGEDARARIIGSNKRLSWSSIETSKRPIKYGKGKFSMVELSPQPSDDPDDPLNWPQWRKELNLGALLLMVSMSGVMKTVFVSVNHLLAEGYDVSYTAAAALTGVPLILSAATGFAALIASRIWGKRPLYLASLLLIFIGAAWNTNVASSYGQCMAARVFQGLGWGAFDTLVMGSIHDTYFEHERCRRVAIYSIVQVATTWGPPLLGGLASQTGTGFGLQFAILSSFFVVAVPLMALGAPETAFDRAYNMAQTPATGASYVKSLPLAPRTSLEAFKDYAAKLKPLAYSAERRDLTVLLQVPRAFIAPTTILLFLATVLPHATLWGLSSSLSLLFSPMPFNLSTASLGALTAGPFILATAVTALFALWPKWHLTFTATRSNTLATTVGSLLSFVGLLAFGLHLSSCMTSLPPSDPGTTTVYALNYLGARVSLPLLSLLLGLVAAGLHVIDSASRPLIRRSTAFTSSDLGVALRNTAHMDAGVAVWRALAAGVFVIAMPNAVWDWEGLRDTCIGVGTAQVVLAGGTAAVWWFWDEGVRRLDGRVMRLVDLDMLKRTSGSFFDTD
ncbi:MFS general substrate transporter [Coniochaeta ligniaria NRRL 30616]|uniref:MFS general substrate transporter n=1 Tax=Coniochaeta ligniaria NRRL 30616 TaxID=1408157 RepID=A0A1J7IMR3_9PEZI|nr:MFS general substrate transporter [Coniochaeta ligniaria NRRL 30616]